MPFCTVRSRCLSPPLSAPSPAEHLPLNSPNGAGGLPEICPHEGPRPLYKPCSPSCPVIRFLESGCLLNPWPSGKASTRTSLPIKSKVNAQGGGSLRPANCAEMKDASYHVTQPRAQDSRPYTVPLPRGGNTANYCAGRGAITSHWMEKAPVRLTCVPRGRLCSLVETHSSGFRTAEKQTMHRFLQKIL